MAEFDPDQTFGFNLHEAARLMRRDFERRAKRHGVTRAQFSALVYLLQSPGLRQAQLAELLDVTPIAVARLVDRMEGEGLVERRHDPGDRRAWRLFLTSRALARIEKLRDVGRETREIALTGIPAKEQEVLLRALQRVRANLVAATTS